MKSMIGDSVQGRARQQSSGLEKTLQKNGLAWFLLVSLADLLKEICRQEERNIQTAPTVSKIRRMSEVEV